MMGNAPDKRFGPLVLLGRGLRLLLLIPAAFAFGLQLLASLFRMPAWITDWLMKGGNPVPACPLHVVVLGGGGIPSESGLMRTYYAARLGVSCPGARFIVSLPTHRDPEVSSVGRMRDELVLRGVPASSICMEHDALNTHEQAEAIAKMLGPDALDEPMVVVTSPFHVRRSFLCFRKVGFTNVAGLAALDVTAEADFGGGVLIRYGFWDALETEIHFTREVVALLYYKLHGWI